MDWAHRAEYIRTRSERKGNAKEFDVEPEWATEAALDPLRLVWDTGSSLGVIGFSGSAPSRDPGAPGRVLKIWLLPKDMDDASTGDWWGTNAVDSSSQDRRDYAKGRRER